MFKNFFSNAQNMPEVKHLKALYTEVKTVKVKK